MAVGQNNLAVVFPGQGCQFVGMGAELYQRSPEARAVYDRADETLGFSLSRLCFEGPQEALNDTANTQPAVYVTSLALWQVLVARLGVPLPGVAFLAGHSLGEYTALTAAGALGFEEGLRLVRCRGEAMAAAGALAPGGMAAIIGLDHEAVAEVVAEANAQGEEVWVANDNAPGQVVIAGREEALRRAMALATARGAKRVVPLAVSVACHTPLMRGAVARLDEALQRAAWQHPWAPVVSNVTAGPLAAPTEIRAALLQQLASPVRWVESVHTLAQHGVETVVEIGPKEVLTGLIKRIEPALKLYPVTNVESVESVIGEVWGP
jgi:[acyl-carrier-protein] S-malonyltransferase